MLDKLSFPGQLCRGMSYFCVCIRKALW